MNAVSYWSAHFGIVAYLCTSCCKVSDTADIRQAIPLKLQKSVSFNIFCLHQKQYPVGICCPPNIWRQLTNDDHAISVSLKSKDDLQTMIYGIGGFEHDGINITNFHYLFMISGKGNAIVQLDFPVTPPSTNVIIIIKRSPTQFP